MQLSFVTNFNEAAVRLQRIEQNLPVKQRALLDTLVPEFIAIQESTLRNVTPVNTRGTDEFSTFPQGNPPLLKDTTTSDVIRAGSNQFESRALIQTYQTKTVPNGGQQIELSDILVKGRTTPPMVPRVKGALYWPNLGHPISSTKNPSVAPPNDYFATAAAQSYSVIEAAAARGVAGMADSLFTLS